VACRTWRNEIKEEKANTSQIGDQISQKYLPAVPLVKGIIEQRRKLITAKTPTT